MKEHNLETKEFELDEIESITLIGDRSTIDITVDDTHMFYANDIYTHNSGATENIIQAHDIADSYRKIMTADFVISSMRNTEDKANNTARFHVIKNRFGPDGLTFYAKMDTGNGDIRIFDAKSPDSVRIQGEMEDVENTVKKALKTRWNSQMAKKRGENQQI
jgi:hypothetical protein